MVTQAAIELVCFPSLPFLVVPCSAWGVCGVIPPSGVWGFGCMRGCYLPGCWGDCFHCCFG